MARSLELKPGWIMAGLFCLLITIGLTVIALPAWSGSSGNIYYVSSDGNNSGSGSKDNPWKTIQRAVDSASAGDTIYVRSGTYKERIVFKRSGTAGAWITLASYPGESAIIDGKGIDWGYDWGSLVDTNKMNYIKISGLRVLNSRWFGIGAYPNSNGCNHIVVENCSTYNTRSSGIAFAHGDDITIAGNTVEKACTSPSQEAITLCNVDVFEIKNNRVFNVAREGIDAKDGCTDGKIYNNEVFNFGVGDPVGRVGIYIDAFSRHEYRIEIFNNKVHGGSQGICVATENGGLLEEILIHHNLVYDCDWGFSIGDWGHGQSHDMIDIYIIYNTAYNNSDGDLRMQNRSAHNVYVGSNTFSGSAYKAIRVLKADPGQLTLDNNVFI